MLRHKGLECDPFVTRFVTESQNILYGEIPPTGLNSLCCRKVPGAGLEPARPEGPGILSPLRLPFRHPGVTAQLTYCTTTSDHPQDSPKFNTLQRKSDFAT